MKCSYLNDGFFSRLEALTLELRANLGGFFGGTKFYYGDGEEDYYLGTDHTGTEIFKFI